ncbi:threonine synthase [Paenibacillus silviterrae]|uniref:threonine synthase n=1 Tax=Paenibacillus silviterrae TaxID=3242194 RepID=UPI0025433161|nr:threonine synthase [Paenibacillus chinjuensis]
MKYQCMNCDRTYGAEAVFNPYLCGCGGVLDIVHDFRSVDTEKLKSLFDLRLSDRVSPYASGVWRYKELIHPELPDPWITTRMEGNTGLYEASPQLSDYAGLRTVWFKAQSENPSGSFKDLGMTVAVSHGRWKGYRAFTCTSTGNTASSLAMYAARGGCRSYVLLPNRHVAAEKALQTLAYGAEIITFDGTYDDGIRFSERHSEELGLYVCNSINPYRIEGQKGMLIELAHSLEWQLPDWIVVPGGALSNATAIGKAIHELYELGFIHRKPRVAIVQAEGASPFTQMLAAQRKELIPEPKPFTKASALNIGNPPSWRKAIRYAIDGCDGVTLSVSDEAILQAKRLIDRSGLGCEPASAATLAGLRQLVRQGTIHRDETAVCILTGHLLKDTESLRELHLGATDLAASTPLSVEELILRIQPGFDTDC